MGEQCVDGGVRMVFPELEQVYTLAGFAKFYIPRCAEFEQSDNVLSIAFGDVLDLEMWCTLQVCPPSNVRRIKNWLHATCYDFLMERVVPEFEPAKPPDIVSDIEPHFAYAQGMMNLISGKLWVSLLAAKPNSDLCILMSAHGDRDTVLKVGIPMAHSIELLR